MCMCVYMREYACAYITCRKDTYAHAFQYLNNTHTHTHTRTHAHTHTRTYLGMSGKLSSCLFCSPTMIVCISGSMVRMSSVSKWFRVLNARAEECVCECAAVNVTASRWDLHTRCTQRLDARLHADSMALGAKRKDSTTRKARRTGS
jgi:hypothetical protein